MFKRYVVTFLLVVVSAGVLMGCAAVLPESDELSETEAVAQSVLVELEGDARVAVIARIDRCIAQPELAAAGCRGCRQDRKHQ